jgi:hypothetical protein
MKQAGRFPKADGRRHLIVSGSYISYSVDSLVWIVMKDVASCDKLGGGACDL